MMFIKECLSRAHAPIPRTFAGLMELYEGNYMRIRRLCPGLDTIPYYAVSRVENTLDLHIQILDRCKYTTTILLTYYFQEGLGHWRPNPNLEVRVYHDARQAEVLSRSYRSPRSRSYVARKAGIPRWAAQKETTTARKNALATVWSATGGADPLRFGGTPWIGEAPKCSLTSVRIPVLEGLRYLLW